jgi:hypothetical protein
MRELVIGNIDLYTHSKGLIRNSFQSCASPLNKKRNIDPFPCYSSELRRKVIPSALVSIRRFPLLSGDLAGVREGGEAGLKRGCPF